MVELGRAKLVRARARDERTDHVAVHDDRRDRRAATAGEPLDERRLVPVVCRLHELVHGRSGDHAGLAARAGDGVVAVVDADGELRVGDPEEPVQARRLDRRAHAVAAEQAGLGVEADDERGRGPGRRAPNEEVGQDLVGRLRDRRSGSGGSLGGRRCGGERRLRRGAGRGGLEPACGAGTGKSQGGNVTARPSCGTRNLCSSGTKACAARPGS